MNIYIVRSEDCGEVEITIRCRAVDERLDRLISCIRLYGSTISGRKDGKLYFLNSEDILYCDTADDKVFIYTSDSVFETALKLYEIEDHFAGTGIIRINKSTILNLLRIDSVESLLNGRIKAALPNGEKFIISRQYVPVFKKMLGL